MTRAEWKKLESIIDQIEALQNKTADKVAKDRLGKAKDELLRLHREAGS